MRASDSERQRTVDELRRHCAAGRIDVDEYARRIEQAMVATTLEELDVLRADLPMMRIAEPAGRMALSPPRPSRRGPGASDGAGEGGPGDPSREARDRLTAIAMSVLAAAVVISVVVIGLLVEWTWAAVLLAGWLAGLLQGWIARRQHPGGS